MTQHPDQPDRRERKKIASRNRIIEETMNAFKEHGFHNITMEQIAELSDISKATLYKYFPVKEAIIAAYWQMEMINTADAFDQLLISHSDTKSRLIALLNGFMIKIMEDRELYLIYIKYRSQNAYDFESNAKLRSGAEKYLIQIFKAGQENSEIRNDVPSNLLAGSFELVVVMQAMIWLREPETFSLEASSKILVDLFLNGARGHE